VDASVAAAAAAALSRDASTGSGGGGGGAGDAAAASPARGPARVTDPKKLAMQRRIALTRLKGKAEGVAGVAEERRFYVEIVDDAYACFAAFLRAARLRS
jgi:hypothetical protein